MDAFPITAAAAGCLVALMAGPLGCQIVWRRMAFFGDALGHASMLGIGLALVAEIAPLPAVIAIAVLLAVSMHLLDRYASLPSDTLLGLLSQGGLALGLIVISLTRQPSLHLQRLLHGDLLTVGADRLLIIALAAFVVLCALALIWHDLVAATIEPDLSRAEGVRVRRAELVFMILLALTVVMAISVVGVLLVTALLIIPAATARRFASAPEPMAFIAAAVGVVAVLLGAGASSMAGIPTGPTIVVAALVLFLASLVLPQRG